MTVGVIRGRVDGQGTLIAADPLLYNLQRRSGASLGERVAVPRIARLVSAAFLSKHPVQGAVVIGDDGRTIRAFVNVVPDDAGANIGISDWQTGPAQSAPSQHRPMDIPSHLGWGWECNGALQMVSLRAGDDAVPPPAHWQGQLVADIFNLHHGDSGEFPLISARRTEGSFEGQRVSFGENDQHDMLLSAVPIRDGKGRFRGFSGTAEPVFSENVLSCPSQQVDEPAPQDLGFNKRVDDALRAPLNRLIAAAETIAGQAAGPVLPDYARYATDIAGAGRHLLGLVDDLADMQNIEKPDFKIAADDIDLGDIGRRAASLMQMRAEEKKITLHVPNENVQMLAIGNFRRTLQILLNLIGNAIRYSPQKSEIWISLDRQRDFASISVTDQGPGISDGHQKIVFEKFERLGRQGGGGSGLGLYIARKLARAMNGDLRVESEIGNGAIFTLSLPHR
jgi:hypothetical protein